MNIQICNPHLIRIILAARKKDSIHAISQRTGMSYGWAYKWCQVLIDLGVFRQKNMKIFLNESNYFYKKSMQYIHDIFSEDVEFYYEALQLFGISYCFTATDAVFIWTKGGYNIGRYKDYYPIFIKVEKKYKRIFNYYCKKLGLQINKKEGIFYHVTYEQTVYSDISLGVPVMPLKETIVFMEQNIYNFEPALEMVHEKYVAETEVNYKDVKTNI